MRSFVATASFLNRVCYEFTRKTYSFSSYYDRPVRNVLGNSINWYPGHMQKGLRAMNLRLANVDVIIELHDARLPFTGRCNFVKDVSQIRPRILIMNKCDLAEPLSDISAFKNILRSRDLCSSYQQPPAEVFFTNMKSPERQKRLIRKILTSLARLSPNTDSYVTSSSNEFSAIERDFEAGGDLTADEVTTTGNGRAELMTMVVGLPNCGKSTFINALRSFAQPGRRRAVAVGKNAGRTRSVGSAIVLAPSFPIAATEGGGVARECCIRVIDTPGILEPRAQTLCGQLSLGVCGALDWDAVDKELLADYLLFCLNRRQRLEYVQVFDMPGPTSNVAELLAWISAHSGLFLRVSSRRTLGDHAAANNKTSLPQPDFTAAAHKFLRLFCEGHLGRLTFRPEDEEEASRFFVLAPGTSGAK